MNAPKAAYQMEQTNAAESQYEMLKRLELSPTEHAEIVQACSKRGVSFLSTPFDHGSVDYLEQLGVVAFKVPSGEITNTPLLTHVAGKGKPVILSTGMSTLDEVARAVDAIKATGNEQLVLLQ